MVCDFLFDFISRHAHISLFPNTQYTGQGTPVIAQASAGADLYVYVDCDRNNTCKTGSMSNTVEWIAVDGVDYLVLITLSESIADTTILDFELEIVGNNQLCEGAHPIFQDDADVVASVENATKQVVIFCEDEAQSNSSQPGVWYKVSGGVGRVCFYMFLSSCSLFAFSQYIVPWARQPCHCRSKWWR